MSYLILFLFVYGRPTVDDNAATPPIELPTAVQFNISCLYVSSFREHTVHSPFFIPASVREISIIFFCSILFFPDCPRLCLHIRILLSVAGSICLYMHCIGVQVSSPRSPASAAEEPLIRIALCYLVGK